MSYSIILENPTKPDFSFFLWLDNFPLRLVERELHDVVGPEVEDIERTLGALLVK